MVVLWTVVYCADGVVYCADGCVNRSFGLLLVVVVCYPQLSSSDSPVCPGPESSVPVSF